MWVNRLARVRTARFWLPATLAALLVWQLLSGRIFLYIHERTVWLVGLSVPLLFAMAVVGFRSQCGHSHIGHRHPSGRLAVVLLVVPLVVVVLAPAQPLGSAALADSRALPAPSLAALPVLEPQADLWTWNLARLGVQRVHDPRLTDLDGQQAALLGFVVHNAELPADQFLVARFVMRCCTADAFALSMPVQYDQAAGLANDSWVNVEGIIHTGGASGAAAVVKASVVEPRPQPSQPYLTP